jgi:hypothetical protein
METGSMISNGKCAAGWRAVFGSNLRALGEFGLRKLGFSIFIMIYYLFFLPQKERIFLSLCTLSTVSNHHRIITSSGTIASI